MPRRSVSPIAPTTLDEAIARVEEIERTRGVGLLIPGDLHLWGVDGGNQSGLFAYLLDVLPYDKVVLLGDAFDSNMPERETEDDRAVLARLRLLDKDRRLHIVRGNHDRAILRDPALVRMRARMRAVGADVLAPDVAWLGDERTHADVVHAEADGVVLRSSVSDEKFVPEAPFSSVDSLVLQVGSGRVYFEHGDRHDKVAKRAHNSSILEWLGTNAFDLMVQIEKRHAGIGDKVGILKQKMSVLRGVCASVARGVHAAGLVHTVTATVSGHTHLPQYIAHEGVPHVNVGSFRGYRPSFAVVTRDTGEVLPPIVVRVGRE